MWKRCLRSLFSFFNHALVKFLLLPLLLALLLSFLPLLWDWDISLKMDKIRSKYLTAPFSEIVMLTVDAQDDLNHRPSNEGSIFGRNASAWRQVHARLLNRLASLKRPPRAVGIDIIFYNRETVHDRRFEAAIRRAHKRGITVVMAVKNRPLKKGHWLYRLHKEKKVKLGLAIATVYKGTKKPVSYVLRDDLYISDQEGNIVDTVTASAFSLHLFDTVFVSKHAAKKVSKNMLRNEVAINYVKQKFIQYNYRDFLEVRRLRKIASKLENKIIIIGVEHPGDTLEFPHIPDGQPRHYSTALKKQLSYGVFYHANALNFFLQQEDIEEVEGEAKILLLFFLMIGFSLLYLLLKRLHLGVKCLVFIGVIVALNVIGVEIAVILPMASANVALLFFTILLSMPESYLLREVGKLKKIQHRYSYMNKALFESRIALLRRPCDNLSSLSEYILLLNHIYVEAEGHTFFEEIPCHYLQQINLLEGRFRKSKVRPGCIGRADYLMEDFVGTRLRRMRNFFAHSNLKEHVIAFALQAMAHYSGKENYLAMNAFHVFRAQLAILDALTIYIVAITEEMAEAQ